MELSSGEVHNIGPEGDHARFSPDARFVVCERIAEGNRDVYVVSVDGSQTSRLPTAPATIRSFSGAPDRTKIAYVVSDSERDGHNRLHVVAVDGSWSRMINTGEKYLASRRLISWSPDSSKIAFALREDLPAEIGVLENFLPPEKVATK